MKPSTQNTIDAFSEALPEAPESGAQWRAPTLDVATLDHVAGDGYVVVLPDGSTRSAVLGPGIDPELARQCLREQRPMLVRSVGDEIRLVGALQTRLSPVSSRDGVVTVSGQKVRLEGEHDVELASGGARLSLQRDGKLSVLGERLTMHVASLIKLIASKVELP